MHARTRPAKVRLAVVRLMAAALLALLGLPGLPTPAAAEDFSGTVDAAGTGWKLHQVQLTAGQIVEATLDWAPSGSDLNLFLRDAAGTTLASATSKTARPEVVSYQVSSSGTYGLGVKAVSGAASYTLRLRDVDAYGGSVDAAGTAWKTHAQRFNGPGVVTATLDWDTSADLNLFLRQGNAVLASATSKTAKPETLTWNVTGPIDLNWGVKAVSGAATYRLRVLFSPATAGFTWPRFMGDERNTGVSPDTTLRASNAASVRQIWQTNTGDRAYSSPVVARSAALSKDVLYVANQAGTLQAFDAASGERIWSFDIRAPISGPATVHDGVVYVGGSDDTLYALNADTGSVLCTYAAGGVIYSAPNVINMGALGKVVFLGDAGITGGDDGGAFHAVNAVDPNSAADCSRLWRYDAFGTPPGSVPAAGVWSSPAFALDVNGKPLVVFGGASPDNAVYALDAETGTRRWAYKTEIRFPDNDVGAGPLVTVPGQNGFADGMVYVPNKNNILYALNLRTGAKLWEFRMADDTPGLTGAARSTPAIVGRTLYLGYGLGVYAIDAITGAKVWKTQDHGLTTGEIISSPAVTGAPGDQVLWAGSMDGNLYAFSLATGQKLWSGKTGSFVLSSPAPAGGRIYISSDDGYLYAYGLDPAAATRPTTTIGSPLNGSSLAHPGAGQRLPLSGQATDDTSVSRVRVAVKDRNAGRWWDAAAGTWSALFTQFDAGLASPGGSSTSWTSSFPVPFDGGVFAIQAEALDAQGQRAASVASSVVTIASAGNPPETTVTYPVTTQVFHFPDGQRQSFPITIRGTASDSGGATPGIAKVLVTVTNIEHSERYCGAPGCGGGTEEGMSEWGSQYAAVPATLSSPGATSTEWTLTFPTYDHPHKYRITAYAVDRDGERDATPFAVQRICIRDVGDNACS